HSEVRSRRRGDHNRVKAWIVQHDADVRHHSDAGIEGAGALEENGVRVRDALEHAEASEIPGEVTAPLTAAQQSDVRLRHIHLVDYSLNLVQDAGDFDGSPPPAEQAGALEASPAKIFAEIATSDDPMHGLRQLRRIRRIDHHGRVTRNLGQRRHARGYHREPTGHRLEHGQPKPLAERGKDEAGGAEVELSQRPRIDVAKELDLVAESK